MKDDNKTQRKEVRRLRKTFEKESKELEKNTEKK